MENNELKNINNNEVKNPVDVSVIKSKYLPIIEQAIEDINKAQQEGDSVAIMRVQKSMSEQAGELANMLHKSGYDESKLNEQDIESISPNWQIYKMWTMLDELSGPSKIGDIDLYRRTVKELKEKV